MFSKRGKSISLRDCPLPSHVLITIRVDFTVHQGQSRLRQTSHGSTVRLNLIRKEESVSGWFKTLCGQIWKKQGDLVLLNLSVNRPSRPLSTTLVSPVNKEVRKKVASNPPRKTSEQEEEEDRLERQKWKSHSAPEPIERRTCTAGGGKLVVEILNYYYEHGTDVITPADKVENCLSCGRSTLLVSNGPERTF